MGVSKSDDCRDLRELRLTGGYNVLSVAGSNRVRGSNPGSHSLTRVMWELGYKSPPLIPLRRGSNIFPFRGEPGALWGRKDA